MGLTAPIQEPPIADRVNLQIQTKPIPPSIGMRNMRIELRLSPSDAEALLLDEASESGLPDVKTLLTRRKTSPREEVQNIIERIIAYRVEQAHVAMSRQELTVGALKAMRPGERCLVWWAKDNNPQQVRLAYAPHVLRTAGWDDVTPPAGALWEPYRVYRMSFGEISPTGKETDQLDLSIYADSSDDETGVDLSGRGIARFFRPLG